MVVVVVLGLLFWGCFWAVEKRGGATGLLFRGFVWEGFISLFDDLESLSWKNGCFT